MSTSLMPIASDPDAARWQAVLARDASRDETFVTAVLSTGVYCRPSCPARHPRRENVVFYSTPQEAERAGFRACLRCRPQDGALRRRQAELVARICRWIEAREDGAVRLAELGRAFGMSPFHLQRTFKRVLGITPRQYAESCRLRALKARLSDGSSVTDAIYEAGYSSPSRIYEHSAAHLGMTPGEYRDGGAGAFICYTTVPSPLGRMLVAASDKGICSVAFGESEAELTRQLCREFPQATLKRRDVVLHRWVRALLQQMYGEAATTHVPLDIRATAFQRRVWEHLKSIPYGATQSYTEVAAAIGAPQAVRAVGAACARNPVPIAIPCHRVVRGDGSLGGYRFGLRRKRKLLDIETQGKRQN